VFREARGLKISMEYGNKTLHFCIAYSNLDQSSHSIYESLQEQILIPLYLWDTNNTLDPKQVSTKSALNDD
jgi:hypothetical protein